VKPEKGLTASLPGEPVPKAPAVSADVAFDSALGDESGKVAVETVGGLEAAFLGDLRGLVPVGIAQGVEDGSFQFSARARHASEDKTRRVCFQLLMTRFVTECFVINAEKVCQRRAFAHSVTAGVVML